MRDEMSPPAGPDLPVVIGVDGSQSARDALDWAAAEAAASARPLWIVHAVLQPREAAPSTARPPEAGTDDVVARRAARRARLIAPEVHVEVRVTVADPATAMLSHRAGMIVLGCRGPATVRSAFIGSVSTVVCARAACPVVIVRPFHTVAPGPSRARVVVGVDGTDLSARALTFALSAAARRGIGLTVLHAWNPRPPADFGGLGDDWTASKDAARARLDSAVAQCRTALPAGGITPTLVCDDPAHALAGESSGAALVVVGSRGLGSMTGLLRGSVSRTLAHSAHCPVAVVRRPNHAVKHAGAA